MESCRFVPNPNPNTSPSPNANPTPTRRLWRDVIVCTHPGEGCWGMLQRQHPIPTLTPTLAPPIILTLTLILALSFFGVRHPTHLTHLTVGIVTTSLSSPRYGCKPQNSPSTSPQPKCCPPVNSALWPLCCLRSTADGTSIDGHVRPTNPQPDAVASDPYFNVVP